MTLLGRIVPSAEPRLRRRFLARHPGATLYADFTDFRIFRMQVERGHWVGGFGQARWLEAEAILADANASQALAEAEPAVLEHRNAARVGSIDLYANPVARPFRQQLATNRHRSSRLRSRARDRVRALSFPSRSATAASFRRSLMTSIVPREDRPRGRQSIDRARLDRACAGSADIMKITQAFRFEAAHWLPGVPPQHRCHRMHGHSYRVELRLDGAVDPQTGFVVDFFDVEKAFGPLMRLMDHNCLNDVRGLENPTCRKHRRLDLGTNNAVAATTLRRPRL